MASKIKGIVIEIGADTKPLEKALDGVKKKSNDIQSELKQVDRLLKLDPKNTTLLEQKQKLLAEAVANTSDKLETLKDAEKQVQAQFAKGDIGEDQYRALQREIISTKQNLGKLKTELSQLDDEKSVKNVRIDMDKLKEASDQAKEAVNTLSDGLGGLVAGAAAGMGIGEIVDQALTKSSVKTKLDISLDVPKESIESVKTAINGVAAYGVDAEEALEGVRKQWQLNKDASNDHNSEVVKGAAVLSKAYSNLDFIEIIQETNEISKALNMADDEAIAMINSLLKVGFPPEQLDIIAEYGTQLSMAGYNAMDIQAIFAAGVETGTWNIDNLMDGLKEGRIKLAEFGSEINKSTADMLQGTSISANQLQEWGKAAANGGEDGKKAMEEVVQALANIEDKTKQNELGIALFGTKFEDQGTAIIDTVLGMNSQLTTTIQNQSDLNTAIDKLDDDPAIKMTKATEDLKVALEPILSIVADVIGKIAEWISYNPELAATITAIVAVLGILIGIFAALAPIITSITLLGGSLGLTIGALSAPVLLAVAGIAALIAIGVALYKNWDEIKAKASETWEGIKETFGKGIDKIKGLLDFEWSFPKLKLPHFGINGEFSLSPPSIPSLSVDWYKEGSVFTKPNVIGVGEGGEPEGVFPLSYLNKLLGSGGNSTVNHTGTIRVEGVNNRGELVAVVEQEITGKVMQDNRRIPNRTSIIPIG